MTQVIHLLNLRAIGKNDRSDLMWRSTVFIYIYQRSTLLLFSTSSTQLIPTLRLIAKMSPSKTSVCTAALSLFPFLASLVVPVITTPTPINGTYPITNGTTNGTSQCRCFPGDSCWPSQSAWSQLNSSVSGRLVASAPLASVCHDPSFNSAECDSLTENWFLSQTQ